MYSTVYTFKVNDSEDADIYINLHLNNWLKTELGEWVLKHTKKQILYSTISDEYKLSYDVHVQVFLEKKDYTFFKLKWSV